MTSRERNGGVKPRVIVVAKRTAYTRFVLEGRDPRAKALIRKRDPSVAHWADSHAEHQRTLETVERVLDRAGVQVLWVWRARAMFDATDAALVVAVGGDGTLLSASHSVDSAPVLGVNSAPRSSVGFFCCQIILRRFLSYAWQCPFPQFAGDSRLNACLLHIGCHERRRQLGS